MALLLTSCRTKEDIRTPYGPFYLDGLVEQVVSERQFSEVSYEKLFTIPATNDVFLYDPTVTIIDDHGYIHVMDHGARKVLRFSPTGEYLTSYGEDGRGQGPGEIVHIGAFGVMGDSMVYVMDAYDYKVAYFSIDGVFQKEKPERAQPWRYEQTATGREYVLFSYSDPRLPLLETRFGNRSTKVISFPDLVGNETDMLTSGDIKAYGENLLYVLHRYPLLLQYEPDGSLVYARATVDYNDNFRKPEIEETILGEMQVQRVVGRSLYSIPLSIENNELFVLAVNPAGAPDTSAFGAFDVYDARNGDYQYSLSLPEKGRYYTTVHNGKVYQTQDSTVVVWEMKW
ncbi:MAG: 6-bladed beta-propeller [Bacteroidetes bacterium]|nr:6-bladed beta-propeller [Bacteroidota bacterium]MCY4205350.1 6-bladed beta-propeller [Bacteroidota bacterium]